MSGSRVVIEKENLLQVARAAGLDINAFLRDIEDPAFQEAVRKQCEDATDAFLVSVVPTVIIGGQRRHVGIVPTSEYLADLAALGVK